MFRTVFALGCNAQFGMENPEQEIGSYEDKKNQDAVINDSSEGNAASE